MPRRYTLEDETALVDEPNHLLHALGLPPSSTDLTPRLLITILESLPGACLPTPMITRTEKQSNPRPAHMQQMKMSFGVLKTNILQRDVSLSTVDPRALAEGDDDAVFHVAEVLAAISRDRELAHARSVPLPRTPSPSPPSSPSPSPAAMTTERPPLSPKSQLDLDAESLFQTGTRTMHPSLLPLPWHLNHHDKSIQRPP